MSPVNRADSVFEISPRHSFLRKIFDSPVTEIPVFATEISVTGMKIFPYEDSSPGNRDQNF